MLRLHLLDSNNIALLAPGRLTAATVARAITAERGKGLALRIHYAANAFDAPVRLATASCGAQDVKSVLVCARVTCCDTAAGRSAPPLLSRPRIQERLSADVPEYL